MCAPHPLVVLDGLVHPLVIGDSLLEIVEGSLLLQCRKVRRRAHLGEHVGFEYLRRPGPHAAQLVTTLLSREGREPEGESERERERESTRVERDGRRRGE